MFAIFGISALLVEFKGPILAIVSAFVGGGLFKLLEHFRLKKKDAKSEGRQDLQNLRELIKELREQHTQYIHEQNLWMEEKTKLHENYLESKRIISELQEDNRKLSTQVEELIEKVNILEGSNNTD